MIEDLLKSSFKMIMSILKILPKKPTLAKFFKKAYKMRAMIIFPSLGIMLLQQPSLDLTWS